MMPRWGVMWALAFALYGASKCCCATVGASLNSSDVLCTRESNVQLGASGCTFARDSA
jgi:hypothetical protein